jgi:ribose transport system permease protein
MNNRIGFKKLTKMENFSVIVIIMLMILVMQFITGNYISLDNFSVLCKTLAIYTIIGVSQMINISCGGMNVSIGATGGLSAVIAAWLMYSHNCNIFLAFLAGVAVGILCGLLNGYLINRIGGVGVASFLITLATTSIFSSLVLIISNGRGIATVNSSFRAIGNTKLFGFLPSSAFFVLAVLIIIYWVYKKTRVGRQMLAFGANPKAAKLYGVDQLKILLSANVIASILASLAGLLLIMRVGSAQVDIGNDWMLSSFAAPLIGGTRQAGGKVNVFGVLLGAIVLTLISNALVFMGVDAYWQELVNGVVILVIMGLDQLRSVTGRNKE